MRNTEARSLTGDTGDRVGPVSSGMSLVFLYGPPSVGKFTTGTALSALTGFGLCHNHLTVDVGRAVFGPSEAARHDLMLSMRLLIAEEAARKQVSVITTLAYSGAVDDPWVEELVRAVEVHGGRVCFVRLIAPLEILKDRITHPHRGPMGKPTDPEGLVRRLAERDCFAAITAYEGLDIDTTFSSAQESAELIARHFGLPGA